MINIEIMKDLSFSTYILFFMLIAYLYIRYKQKHIQKKYNFNNFEIWVFTHLIDYYKNRWYEERESVEYSIKTIKLLKTDDFFKLL